MQQGDLASNLILDGFTGDVINIETGEIIKREYEVAPYHHKSSSFNAKCPEDCKSKDELYSWMKQHGVDRRRLVLHDEVNKIFRDDHGQAKLHGKKPVFKKSHQKHLDKLVKVLDFRNIIIDTRQNIAKALEINESNLTRVLNSLQGYITYKTDKTSMDRGQVMIVIAPVYGFRHESPKAGAWNINWALEEATERYLSWRYKPALDFDVIKEEEAKRVA